MKKILSVLILGLTLSLTCQAQDAPNTGKPSFTRLDKIIAVINREVITQSELSKEMDQARKQMEHMNQTPPPEGEFRKLVLDNLINKNLQFQACKTKNIKVPEEDVTKAIKTIAKANHISEAQLKEAVEQSGLTWDTYKTQIHEQLLLQKLQQEEVAKTVTLGPEDVKKFVQENRDKLNHYDAYHLVDVMLPTPENAAGNQVEQIKKQAGEISKQLQTNKDIDAVLKQYPYAQKNDLGWAGLADIPSLFQATVAGMRINKVSAPIQAPNGFHILKLIDAKGQNVKLTENQLKGMAFQNKVNGEVKNWLQKLRNESYIKIMN